MMRAVLILLVVGCAGLVAMAAEDPSDIYYRGYLEVKTSEEMEKQGKLAEALLATDRATRYFSQLEGGFPDFHPEIVTNRLKMLKASRIMLVSQIKGEKPEMDSTDKAELQRHLDTLLRQNLDLKERIEKLEEELRELKGEEAAPSTGPQNPLLPQPNAEQEKKIPDNWKARPFEGQDYYLVPLVETTQTKPLSGSRFLGEDGPGMVVLKPQPAIYRGR